MCSCLIFLQHVIFTVKAGRWLTMIFMILWSRLLVFSGTQKVTQQKEYSRLPLKLTLLIRKKVLTLGEPVNFKGTPHIWGHFRHRKRQKLSLKVVKWFYLSKHNQINFGALFFWKKFWNIFLRKCHSWSSICRLCNSS